MLLTHFTFSNIPNLFTKAEYASIVFIYGVCNGNALVHLKNTNLRTHLCSPSHGVSSERVNEQDLAEEENIMEQVEQDLAKDCQRISAQMRISEFGKNCTHEVCDQFTSRKFRAYIQAIIINDLGFADGLLIGYLFFFTDEATFTHNDVNNARYNYQWYNKNPRSVVE